MLLRLPNAPPDFVWQFEHGWSNLDGVQKVPHV